MTAQTFIIMPDRRSVPEWVGKSPDEAVPPRIRLRTLLRFDRKCAGPRCGRTIRGTRWICDHIVAIINGGENRESNLQPLCEFCNPHKNAADVAAKSKTADVSKAHYGIRDKRPSKLSREYRREALARYQRRQKDEAQSP